MKVAILSCILGNFDEPHDPVAQTVPATFHRFTDENFPPITGLTPRLQYRIPKTHGWEMFPGYDYYLWIDGAYTLQRPDSIEWYLDQLGDNDIGMFEHPQRRKVEQEIKYIQGKLDENHPYIVSRYKNGLHYAQFAKYRFDYPDNSLYHSGIFFYRNTPKVQAMLKDWWYEGSRHFTVDQIALPFLLKKHKLKVKVFDEPINKSGHTSLVSHHK